MLKNHRSFLWGCKCRSGKTYMVGGIIIKHFNQRKHTNTLIITPSPTETTKQFTDDLFNKFIDFQPFNIVNLDSSLKIKNLELKENNIIVISKQLLQNYTKNKTIINIKNLKLDFIVFDENHFTGTTDISKHIFSSYSGCNTTII